MKSTSTIYLDHQATTPLDSQVFEAMRPYFGESFGNPHSSDHATGWRAAKAVEGAAEDVAAMIGADADEIVFTSGATEANNLALLGVARRAVGGARNRILMGSTEHKCVLEVGRVLERQLGFEIIHLPVDSEGRLDLEMLRSELNEDVLLVSVMAANNEIGTLQDIPEIARMTSQFGSLLHCDSAQAPCAMDMARFADLVDLVSLSAHKMYGPMGIGALYVRRELHSRIEPLVYGGGQQNGLRSGTLPTALCVGLGRAARLASDEHAVIERETLALRRDFLLRRLSELPYPTWVNGPKNPEHRHPGNINIGFRGIVAADLLGRIQPSLAASTGSACTSGIPEPSHVLRAIGLTDEEAGASIRLSVGRSSTEEELVKAVDIIRAALDQISRENVSVFA
ncbi:cysteine desulfurase family protein [Thioclava pacifica]|nr:cysteine desulfurase family protein [Thioclava pacifica]